MLPALALAALVVLTAMMSRHLGANRAGQVLAALATATCGEYLGAMHELTTTTPNFVFWAVTLLLVMRLLASQDPRWWLAIGGCIGAGSEAKWNIVFLAAALAAGFLVTGQRTLLRSRYLLLGCVLAAALAAPDVIWQAAHGWPQLDVFRALQGRAQPGHLLDRADPVHRAGPHPDLGDGRDLVAAQPGGAPVPPGGAGQRDRDRGAVRAGRQAVLLRRGLHVPAFRDYS